MDGEIISIGDELVSGKVLNTTSGFAASKLFEAGYTIRRITSVGDSPEDIREALLAALAKSAFVVVTGGLGPTTDDITSEIVAETLHRQLVVYPDVLERLIAADMGGGKEALRMQKKMARLPEGAEILAPRDHAAGYLLMHAGTPLFFLPGVPGQLRKLTTEHLLPRLRSLIPPGVVVRQKTYRTFGLHETEINVALAPVLEVQNNLNVGYYPNFPEVLVTLTARAKTAQEADAECPRAYAFVERALGEHIVATDDETLESVVGGLLKKNHATLGTAESCTGGLIGHRITKVPGSSEWFDRGVITYSNRSKEEILGVQADTLRKFGAVSRQTAAEMAGAIRRLAGVDYGLAVTGIAGPSGGSEEKPVGTVFIALAMATRTLVERFHFPGNRHMIQELTAETALDWLRRHLAYGTDIPGYRPAPSAA